jgi:hypothetical protein
MPDKVGAVLVVGAGIGKLRVWHELNLFCRDGAYDDHRSGLS